MTDKMIVTVHEDGEVQHTLKDEFFKPFSAQKRSVVRMSEILFDEEQQEFYVQFLKGFIRDDEFGVFTPEFNRNQLNEKIRYTFWETYKDAVEFEVSLADDLRSGGFRFV